VVELLDEDFRDDDRVARAPWQSGTQAGLQQCGIERGEDLAGAGAMEWRTAGIGGVAQGSPPLHPLDVDDVGVGGDADLHGFLELVA
jgi:hypothetical protein